MDLKGSETEKNLYKTFAGESRARNKYYLYSDKAKAEGFMWVGEVFKETAENEYAHARQVFETYLGKVSTTKNNLIEAALGEAEESNVIYKEFEKTAREEGFNEIADFYKELREVEEHHKERFLALAKKIKENEMFSSNEDASWQCMNCGYIYEGTKVPEKCPLCKYPKGYFKKIESC